MRGDTTEKERFAMPVIIAKMVPSIFLGVTYAKYDMRGMKKNDEVMFPRIPSIIKLNQKFDRPILVFH